MSDHCLSRGKFTSQDLGSGPKRARLKTDWGTLVPRINVENVIRLEFVLE
jgi:hypothetical protein